MVVTEEDPAVIESLAPFKAEVVNLKFKIANHLDQTFCLARRPTDPPKGTCKIEETYLHGGDACNFISKVSQQCAPGISPLLNPCPYCSSPQAFMFSEKTADIAINNAGGCRTDMFGGDFTYEDAYTVLPFDNTMVVLDATGQDIKNVLEDAIANYLDLGGSDGSYPYAAGLKFEVDESKPKGERICCMEINPRLAGEYTDVDMAKTYKVVANDFIAAGQDGYDSFGALPSVNTFTQYTQSLLDYLEHLKSDDGIDHIGPYPAVDQSTKKFTDNKGCVHDSLDAMCPTDSGATSRGLPGDGKIFTGDSDAFLKRHMGTKKAAAIARGMGSLGLGSDTRKRKIFDLALVTRLGDPTMSAWDGLMGGATFGA